MLFITIEKENDGIKKNKKLKILIKNGLDFRKNNPSIPFWQKNTLINYIQKIYLEEKLK